MHVVHKHNIEVLNKYECFVLLATVSCVALQCLLLMLSVCTCTVASHLCVYVRERESARIDFVSLSLSLLQPYCSSLSDLHTLCRLLVRKLGCLGVCQLSAVVASHSCLCILSSSYISDRGRADPPSAP